MTLFGLSYVIVHDGLVHGRLPVAFLERWGYLRRVARCHRVHHGTRAGGAPYGLFFGAWELSLRAQLKRRLRRRGARRAPT